MQEELFTNREKEFLAMLLNIGDTIIDGAGGYYELKTYEETFDRNDLYNLSLKLGIDY